MFVYGDLVVERQIYKSGATSKVYMFIQPISVDPIHCIVYDIQCNNLVFKDMYSLVSRKKFIGIKPLRITTDYIYNHLVYTQVQTYISNQQEIAKQKFVFLRDIVDRGVTLRVNGHSFRPTEVYYKPENHVYWQDMIGFTGWSQVGETHDYIHLSTLLPNSRYLQQIVEID